MRKGKIKIIGGRMGQEPLRGQDIAVVMELEDGEEVMVPALSLVLRVGSRHEQAIATVEVPAVLIDLHGVELRTEAVVVPGGPESQWEEALGKRPGLRIADAETYTDPHVVAGAPIHPSVAPFMAALTKDMDTKLAVHLLTSDAADDFGKGLALVAETDPMAELDRLIEEGGSVVNVLPRGPESAFEASQTAPFDATVRFTEPVKSHP